MINLSKVFKDKGIGDHMDKLILSTDNEGKFQEISHMLSDLDIEVMRKSDVGLGDVEPVEDGNSLEENARIKVDALDIKDAYILGDDTGLYVEALNGEPGIHAARYAGEHVTDEDNRKKMLKALEGESNRKAYFKTVMALRYNDKIWYTEGVCEGKITEEEHGELGFGYDSIFLPNESDETFGEMSEESKNQISHRSKALKNLSSLLKELI